MISADLLRAAVEAIRRIAAGPAEVLSNLTGRANGADFPKAWTRESSHANLPTLTHAEIADYMCRARWDPNNAEELAKIEFSIDFGYGLDQKQLQILIDLISMVPGDQRNLFQLDLIDLVARWLLRREQAVTPNGGAVVGVRTLVEAKVTVAGWLESEMSRRNKKRPRSLAVPKTRGQIAVSTPQALTGRIELGRTVSILQDELRHLRTFARGRRKTESGLRLRFPDLQLWREIDASESLPPKEKRLFFEKSLDLYGRTRLMDFIGSIVALSGPTAYNLYKAYRDYAGLKRKRIASQKPSTSSASLESRAQTDISST